MTECEEKKGRRGEEEKRKDVGGEKRSGGGDELNLAGCVLHWDTVSLSLILLQLWRH